MSLHCAIGQEHMTVWATDSRRYCECRFMLSADHATVCAAIPDEPLTTQARHGRTTLLCQTGRLHPHSIQITLQLQEPRRLLRNQSLLSFTPVLPASSATVPYTWRFFSFGDDPLVSAIGVSCCGETLAFKFELSPELPPSVWSMRVLPCRTRSRALVTERLLDTSSSTTVGRPLFSTPTYTTTTTTTSATSTSTSTTSHMPTKRRHSDSSTRLPRAVSICSVGR